MLQLGSEQDNKSITEQFGLQGVTKEIVRQISIAAHRDCGLRKPYRSKETKDPFRARTTDEKHSEEKPLFKENLVTGKINLIYS